MFFRFPPMGKFNKTRFERNWTTFVNPAFSAAWKSPPKMVAWNRNCKIRSQGCFLASPRWGKLKKRAFERNSTTFLTPAFCASWKSPPKMVAWNRNFKIRSQGCFFVSPRWGNLTKRVLNAIGPLSWTRLFPLLGKAHPKWWHETEIVKFDATAVFFCLAKMWKVEKTRFERNWTTLVNPAFSAAWKSPPKMVVWNKPRGIRSQGCFFVSPRWGKTKKRVFNAIGRTLSTPLFALLAKAHQKWWYETDLVEFDPKGVFSFRNDGESRKNEFSTQLDDLRQPGFLQCLQKPGKNGGMKPKLVNSIPRVILRFAVMGKVEKTSFERNWTTFVNPAFYAACKSPPKMVVWNLPRGIRSQGCFFVSPRWGNSKKRVLNAIGRPS